MAHLFPRQETVVEVGPPPQPLLPAVITGQLIILILIPAAGALGGARSLVPPFLCLLIRVAQALIP